MLLPSLPLEKKTIRAGLNPIIASVMIDPHMVVTQVQVSKNIVQGILLDGGSNVNIMTEELWKRLRLPNPKPKTWMTQCVQFLEGSIG
jgi:hypothetical protein